MSDRLPKVVESDRKLQELIENQNWYVQEKQRYEVAKKNVFIPADARTVFSIYMGRSYYIWVAGDSLLFFPLPPNSKPAGSDVPRAEYYLEQVPLEDIYYFRSEEIASPPSGEACDVTRRMYVKMKWRDEVVNWYFLPEDYYAFSDLIPDKSFEMVTGER